MIARGWKLDAEDRALLLRRFPPAWPDVVADHVTFTSRDAEEEPPPDADHGMVVGHVDDGEGLQALVIEIEGTTARPDGSTYHITWSIDRARGRKPKDSNDALARSCWNPLDDPLPVRLIPASWP